MRDPVHPFSDAGMLAKEMPNAQLLEADSLVELRMRPERLTGEIADFLDEVWKSRRSARSTKKPAAKAPARRPRKRAAAGARG